MHVVHVNTSSQAGGAAAVARELHLRMRQLSGVQSSLLSHIRTDSIPDNFLIPVTRNTIGAIPAILRERLLGHQFLHYPDSFRLRELLTTAPDIYHLHNLHSWYFDLAAIHHLAKQAPIIITLHDEWLYTGHCGFTIACDRWQIGCGKCPDLERHPMIHADGTAFNLRRKQRIFTPDLPIQICAPSQWLLDRIHSTYLWHYPTQVIYNGVDTAIFSPGDSTAARQQLNLPLDKPILLFSAGAPHNIYKDFPTLIAAMQALMQRLDPEKRPCLVALGGSVQEPLENLITPGYITDPHQMARYYQAASLVIHASRADNGPLAVLEAMASGKPVIGSQVGGIPEIIGDTGLLVPPQDVAALVVAIMTLLDDPAKREALGKAARLRAEKYFDLDQQVALTVNWYKEILHVH